VLLGEGGGLLGGKEVHRWGVFLFCFGGGGGEAGFGGGGGEGVWGLGAWVVYLGVLFLGVFCVGGGEGVLLVVGGGGGGGGGGRARFFWGKVCGRLGACGGWLGGVEGREGKRLGVRDGAEETISHA